MFYLLRLIVELMAPLSLSLLILVITLLLLLFKRKKSAAVFLCCGIFILVFCGYGVGVRTYIYNQENSFPPLTDDRLTAIQNQDIRYVVVLGSGHVSDNRLPETSQIGGSSLYRLIEGVRIQRHFADIKLVISGGVGYDPVPNAQVVSSVAKSIGVSPDKIIIENRPRDTMEEAEAIFPLVGNQEFVLVSSALHMPRAIEIFKSRGMQPIAAPTDYIIKNHIVKPAGSIFPSAANLDLSRRIIYEWIGKQWVKLKRLIKNYQ